jgi:hypothetical protein
MYILAGLVTRPDYTWMLLTLFLIITLIAVSILYGKQLCYELYSNTFIGILHFTGWMIWFFSSKVNFLGYFLAKKDCKRFVSC